MPRETLQYQKLAEPLEPSLIVAPPELSWYFQHPQRPPARRRTPYYLPLSNTVEPTTFTTLVFQVAPVLLGSITKDVLTQHQSQAEPLEPSLFTAAPGVAWYSQHPAAPPRRPRTAHFLHYERHAEPIAAVTAIDWQVEHFNPPLAARRAAWFEAYEKTVEPSLYVTPSLDFYRQQPTPPLPRKRTAEYFAFAYIPEPTVFETPVEAPALDGWVQPTSQPLNHTPSRRHAYPDLAKPLEPSLFVATQVDMWYVQHPTRPPARVLPTAHYPTFMKPWEPTTYIVPDLSTWYVQHPTKPPPKPRAIEFPALSYVAEPTVWDILFVPPMDGWTQPISQPLFDKPRAAWFEPFVGQPLEPSLFTAVAIDWYVEHFNPTLRKPQPAWMQPFASHVEPTLMEYVPDMCTWYVQHPPRLLPSRRAIDFLFVTPTIQTGPVPGLDIFYLIVTGTDEAAYFVEASDEAAYLATGTDGTF